MLRIILCVSLSACRIARMHYHRPALSLEAILVTETMGTSQVVSSGMVQLYRFGHFHFHFCPL